MNLENKTLTQLKAMESVLSLVYYHEYSREDIFHLLAAVIYEIERRTRGDRNGL